MNPRILVALAAVVSGIVLGVIVIGMVGGGGSSRPSTYQPFLAGSRDRITRSIRQDGPIFYPDPRGGTRAFYLDLDDGAVVALHVIPESGAENCPAQWDRKSKRYVDCRDSPVDPTTLRRFPIIENPSRPEAVYVDLRTLEPAPSG